MPIKPPDQKNTPPEKESDEESTPQERRILDELFDRIRENELTVDTKVIEEAFYFAEDSHGDQKRSSGEPYIQHPVEVAKILCDLHLDTASIVTGLLHDTVEDTKVSLAEIEEHFGKDVAHLVDGVTKISKITFQTTEEKQAENFRKMILAMAKDLRVILVKLSDRLHNMRTLQHLNPAKQAKIAQETLDIYSPLANRLGLYSVRRELEDLALRFTKPEFYYRLVAQVAKKRQERETYTQKVKALIEEALKKHGYEDVEISGRPKHFYSIHKKMEQNNLTYEQIYDITGFRIIVDNVANCYATLGLMHSIWTPVPGRFKDYIAIPKANFYQSLHTTVIGPEGEHIEIQIRTGEMHETAERGIAAHWAYKEGTISEKERKRFDWLNRLVEWNRDLSDPNEFLETVKLDLFAEEVYVFTPKGEVREFPQGATPLDFAYAVHTDVGHRCMGARINNRMVPLKYKLRSGDTVEIITSVNQRPHKDWLKIVVTSRAKNKIRAYIKAEEHERSLGMGTMILERELKKSKLTIKELTKNGKLKEVAESFSYRTEDDLLSALGYGKLSVNKLLTRLLPKEDVPEKQEKGPLQKMFENAAKKAPRHAVKVQGVEDLLVRFAKCCQPVPGDSVVGFITRGRGISVHSRNCPKIFDSDPHRLVEIDWDLSKKAERSAKLRVVCEDKPGLLAEMSRVIRDLNVNITRAQIGTTRDQKAICHFTVLIRDLIQLREVISKLEGVEGVVLVERIQKRDRSS